MQLVRHGNGWKARDWGERDLVTGHRPRLVATGRTRSQARERLEAKRAEAATAIGAPAPKQLTLGQLIAWWRASKTSAATTNDVVEQCVALIPASLMAAQLRTIGPRTLEALYAALQAGDRPNGRPLAANTVRRLHGVVRAAYSAGERWGLLTDNVARRAVPPPPPPERLSIPSVGAVKTMLQRSDEEDPSWSLFLRLLATSGLRRSEALGLQWGDIDAAELVARIRRSVTEVTGGIAVGTCKTPRSRRDIPLEQHTAELLADRCDEQQAFAAEVGLEWSADWFVWPGEMGEPFGLTPTSPRTVKSRWHKHRGSLGMAGVRMHDLRHFAATQMIAAGVDPVTVAAILGHANPSITLRLYAHIVDDRMRAAANIMGQVLNDED